MRSMGLVSGNANRHLHADGNLLATRRLAGFPLTRRLYSANGITTPPSASGASASGSPQPFRGPLDFAALRRQVTLRQVLQHLGVLHRFRNSSGAGSQLRGPCPLHQSRSERGRTFSVDLQRNIFRCFNPSCAAQGNVLDLCAAYHGLPLHAAALHLAETFGVIPSHLENGSQTQKQSRLPCGRLGNRTSAYGLRAVSRRF